MEIISTEKKNEPHDKLQRNKEMEAMDRLLERCRELVCEDEEGGTPDMEHRDTTTIEKIQENDLEQMTGDLTDKNGSRTGDHFIEEPPGEAIERLLESCRTSGDHNGKGHSTDQKPILLQSWLPGGPPPWMCPAPSPRPTCVGTASRGTTQMSPYGWPSMPYHILTILPRGVPTVPPLRLSCLKGVQAALRGGRNAHSWLAESGMWLTPASTSGIWLPPRRRRSLHLFEPAAEILDLNHRILQPALLRALRVVGDCRFLRPPELLAPRRWLGWRIGELTGPAPNITIATRGALTDVAALGSFCTRLITQNARGRYRVDSLADAIVVRGTTTAFQRLTTRTARRLLEPGLPSGVAPSRGTMLTLPCGWPCTPFPIQHIRLQPGSPASPVGPETCHWPTATGPVVGSGLSSWRPSPSSNGLLTCKAGSSGMTWRTTPWPSWRPPRPASTSTSWAWRPHLRDIVPECQSYAVPGRTPAWNIARVADEVATACRDEAPLAVVAMDLESAFDTLDRGFLVSTLLSVGLPPVFVGWVLLLYAGAEAAAKIEGIGRTPLFHMLNGVRQGCAASAAFFTISTGPLLLRLEQLLGRDNVLAYADDIVLLIREDGQLEVVRKIFEDFRRASGIRVNFGKSQGLWCGRWRNRTDSPSAISWNREKINILGTLVTPGMGTSAQDQHLQELLERAIARWSPFVRGLSLAGRAKAANSLVLSAIYYHLQAYLPSETTIGRLQARLARFVWGHDRTSWLPSSILARPISVGGMGLLDVGTQLRLSCLKGVQAALRGGRNAHSWLAESGMWLTPASTPGIWLPPRRRRSLHLFEPAAEILDLNHRILQPALLRALRVVGDCRFLRPPELLAPRRWLGWRIGELTGPAPNITIATRGALTDVAALGSFCTRLITQNARGRYRVDSLADAIVVRGTTTAFQRLTTRTARRLLERPRLAALPITQLFGRWFPHVSIPISISWSSLRRCAFSGHNADVAVRLALHALPHPAHPASARESCIACGSEDLSLAHRYWSCSRIRPVILEAFTILQRPPDLQSWIFGHDLEDDALAIMASAKTRIYKHFLGLEMRGTSIKVFQLSIVSLSLSAVRPRGARAPRSSAMEGEKMEISNVFSVLADGQYEGEHDGVVSGDKSPANAEILAEITSKKNSTNSETLENYAKLPVTSGGNANFPQSSRNWADIVENDENFEQPKKRKRLLPSERASQSLPGPSRQTKTTRDSTTPRQPSCPRNTIEQIKVSRQMLAQCRSKAAAGTYDQMTYLEFSPEFTQVDYIKALENKLGKGCVVQIGKASGQILIGFERPDMAETIIEDGLMIKGALLKALPYQKKAEKITISGLPFVIEDADIIRTLRPYCQVVSIAPTVNSSGGYTWLDLKKTAFILMNNGKKITDLPKKIIVTAKGGSALAYLEYGFRCSKCYRMGHKRMNCPRIIRETSTTQPLSQTSSVKTTAPAPNTTAAASPPATFSHPAPVAAPAQTSSAPPAQEDIALETEPTTRTPETSIQTDLNINRVENSSHHKIKDRSRSLSPKAGSTAQLQLDTLLERLPGSFFGEVTLLGLKEEEVKQAIVSLPHLRLLLEKLSVEQSLGLHTFNEKLIKGLGGSKSALYKRLSDIRTKTRSAQELLPCHAVDIAFIQETNVTTLDSVEDLCLGYRAAVVPASGARGSGLACIFSSGVQVIGQQVLSPGKIAAFDVTIRGSKATFVNCHLSHAPDERLQQLQVIAAAAVNEDAWVLGDLNISEESASDIASGSVEALGELLDRANLVDAAAIFDATHLPTRISSCGSRVDASRLDRVLIPSSFSNRVTRYWSLYYKNSDHRAVLLQTGEASEPRPPCIASMLRSRLVVGTVETLLDEALGNIEDMRNAEIWRRWGHIKAHLASAIKSLHDLRNNDDDYISRARKYVQAKLEDVSIYSDYPSLPDLGRAFRLRRRGTSSNTFYDSAGRMITGPAVRELAFVNLKERFSHPSCSPEDIDGFLRGFTLRVTIEESDPLHRYGIGEEEIVAAIGRLPTGKADGWDDLPCELFRGFEDYFASALRRVFEASQLCVALPTSMRRSEMSLIEKPHGGPGLAGLRPLSLPTTDYRVLSGVLYWRLRPHLRDIVPECQSYAVPGRTPAWNIARVADEVATACRDEAPLAVVAIDLESAFDTLDRGFLVSTLLSVGLPPVFVGWVLLLYAGAEAAARIEGIGRTPLFHMLNGVRQGCAASAAFFTISTGPLLLRLEQLLGRDNVLAYADDIVLLIREDGQLEVVRKIFEDFRRASGIRVNFGKSQGLWCGRWRNRTDSPSAISWNREKINILGTLVTPGMGTSAQDQHLQELLERAIARWSPFVRGLSLAGRAKAANSLVLSAIYYHLQAYLPSETTIGRLQARLARFVWGHDRTSWLPSSILARPISVGGMGLLDVGTQLRLSCLKGVQAALRGGRNAHSWLAESGMWLTLASTPGIWLPPRRRRSLHLFEPAAEILDLNHRILQPALLRALRVVGDCRFLRPPELLAPTRWLGWRIGELTGPAPNITIATRGALTDVAALGSFCTRLITQNARGRYRVDSLADAIVVRGTTTAFQRLTTRTARRLLERPRLAALPITQLFGRWFPQVSIPISISWSSLRRCAFSGHNADVAVRLALHALPHPAHPASARESCIACGSGDLSLAHRYWSCSRIRPVILEAFTILQRPPDLQSWIFGHDLEDDALAIMVSAKTRIYKHFLGLEMRGVQEDPLLVWRRTLSSRNWADIVENDENFEQIKKRKRLLPSERASQSLPGPSRQTKTTRDSTTPRQPSCPRNTIEQIKVSRQMLAQCRSKAAARTYDQMTYLEFSPEFTQVDYIKALENKLGKGCVVQIGKASGQILVGFERPDMAETIIEDGLMIKGALLKAYQKKAEKNHHQRSPICNRGRRYHQESEALLSASSSISSHCSSGNLERPSALPWSPVFLHSIVKLYEDKINAHRCSRADMFDDISRLGFSMWCKGLLSVINSNFLPKRQEARKSFRLACLNVRGIAARHRSIELCCFLKQHAVDIAFIQETNVTTLDSVEDLCLGYRAAVVPASGARGSGLACIFSSGVQVIGQQVLSPGKIAAFDVTIRGSKATFVNCHLSHAPDERLQQLQVIAAAAVNEDAWVLGDLNISEESASDIASGSVEALGELLDRANLVDAAAIFDATHLPTRISSCGSRVDASRLDRVLIPSRFSNRVTRYWSLYYKNSDHRAVLLQTGEASEPRPPCIASMLRSRLVVGTVETLLDEALGNIEDMRNAEIWRRWGHIKAHLASAIKSLHDLRNNDDDYISRARKYVQAKLEDVSIYSDYPSLPDLGRAFRLRRRGTSSNTFYDSAGRMITGPAVRELAFVNLKERFSHPSCSPEDIDGFLRGFTLRVTIEESDPLHRYGIGEEEIVAAIGRLPTGKAAGWDDLPCELFRGFEDYFASALRRVFEASQLCGALPTSMRRSEMSLIGKPHGGPGLAGLRPLSLPTTDYRVLSGVLYWRLRPHLRDIVPECQSYAVPGRTPAWNIARVADEVATACRDEAPLAVVAIDLESAFDTLDRGFLVSTLLSVGLPPVFVGWVLLLYAGAEAAARIEGIGRTPLFHMLNGVRQGCAASAAFFTISTGPLLLRLEQLLGRDNVLAYADDIVLLIREDGQLEVVRKIFEDFRRASGIRVNF
ncbi:hypothetical protein LAZ67_14002145, partial [Cordylochernes scorpioides]